jgi:hypothetical protein
LLRQLPDLNEIIRRLTVNRDRYSFNRNIFLATAITAGETLTGLSELKVKGREARNVTATKNYTFVLIIVN